MLPNQRHLFEIPGDVAYFNAAYMGPLLSAAAKAGREGLESRAAPWKTTPPDFFSTSERVRELAAKLWGASADHVALVPAASYGLATAARNLPVEKGQTILTLADQFPSNIYVWRKLAAARGANVRMAARGANESWTDAVLNALDRGCAVLALPQVHWVDGGRLDLERIAAAAREANAALALDLTQSLGALPFDAAAVDPDFAVAACYKWQLGPYSTGTLYVAERHWRGQALEENWIVRRRAEDFAGLTNYADEYESGARKFDMGERSNFQLLPMVEAALSQIVEWTPEAVSETLGAFNATLARALEEAGLDCGGAPDRANHYLTAALPDGAPDTLIPQLAEKNVYISQRGPRLRITPHLHANEDDIDRVTGALATVLG